MDFTVNSDRSLETFLQQATKLYHQHRYVRFVAKTGNKRTNLQNRSLHKYCAQIADELNSRGLDQQLVLNERPELAWTMDSVKENLVRPILIAISGNYSTVDAKTTDYHQLHDTLNRFLIDNFNVAVGWPSRD